MLMLINKGKYDDAIELGIETKEKLSANYFENKTKFNCLNFFFMIFFTFIE